MKKVLIGIIISTILLMPFCQGGEDEVKKEGIVVESDKIVINNGEVEEDIIYESVLSNYNGTLQIWAPYEKTEIKYEGNILEGKREGNIISLYLGDYNITIPFGENISIKITYSISDKFEKKFIYETDELEIQIHSEKYPRGNIPLVYKGNNTYTYSSSQPFNPDESFWLEFIVQKQKESNFSYLILGIAAIFLAVILIGYIAFTAKGKGKTLAKESDEALELRKRLLMDALKTLEIEHDKGKISDVYYNSIKDYFKREAIKVLKEIERRK